MCSARLTTAIVVLILMHPVMARAQEDDTRPATTTVTGDTGLWFVPTGEVLPTGHVSVSIHRTETDYRQGNTNVSSWPVTAAVGAGRAELFGALRVITRIDRDTTPLLFAGPDNEAGGLVNEYPSVRDSWTGNKLGDLYLGAKLNLLSQQRLQPMALAVRGTVKLPTGDSDDGAGTGEYDGFFDLVASREFRGVELTGFGGVALRGDLDAVSVSDGIRWGGGAAFPARRSVRATAELFGEWMFDSAVRAPEGLIVAADGSLSPADSRLTNEINAAVGLTWQHPSGVLLGAALSYRFDLETDPAAGTPANTSGDALGVQFRIGFHRGVKVFVPPPPALARAPEPAPAPAPAPAPPPPPPAPAANRGPSIRASCEPCSVQMGGTATLRADATDPDGDALALSWTASGGTLSEVRGALTTWRAETAAGLVTFTVTAEDSRGGKASDKVTINVTAGTRLEFEDVLFDFDSYQLRPQALPSLDPVVAALKQNPGAQVVIEGHTCNVGTAEYNLALGERRASAVRTYLLEHGIEAARLSTISYGEERPAHDNDAADTRRLNRRAVFVVRATDSESR